MNTQTIGPVITPSPIENHIASLVDGCVSISCINKIQKTISVAMMHTVATILFKYFLFIIYILLKNIDFIDNTYQKTPISSVSYICTANVSKTSSIWVYQPIHRAKRDSYSKYRITPVLSHYSYSYGTSTHEFVKPSSRL